MADRRLNINLISDRILRRLNINLISERILLLQDNISARKIVVGRKFVVVTAAVCD